jgi:ketosteroid isomerase-like protein
MTASANLDLVRWIFAAWEHGDFSSAEWAHPEIEYAEIGDGPDAGISRGKTEMAETVRTVLGVMKDVRVKPGEYRELDHERVFVLTTLSASGKSSGVKIEGQKGAALFCIRDGKVTRLAVYTDRKRALADLGLAQEGDSER